MEATEHLVWPPPAAGSPHASKIAPWVKFSGPHGFNDVPLRPAEVI